MWLLLSLAVADELVLTDLSMNADDGVSLSYVLSPSSWTECSSQFQRMGDAPKLVVTVESGGMKKTQYVELREASRTVSIASGTWPKGLTAQIDLSVGGGNVFTMLSTPHGKGSRIRVPVAGGRDDANPLGMQPTPSPAPAPQPSANSNTHSGGAVQVQPVQVDPVVVARQALEVQRRIEEERARQAEMAAHREAVERARQAEQAFLNEIAADPNHPVTQACTSVYTPPEDGTCIVWAAHRPNGAEEVMACGRITHAGLRKDCLKFMTKATFVGAPTMNACADAFETEKEAFQCFHRARTAETPPAVDIEACAEAFELTHERFSCMSRFSALEWSPALVVPACREHYPGNTLDCMHKISSGAKTPHPALAGACATAFKGGKLENNWECLAMMHRRDGDPAGSVDACATLWEEPKDRLVCIELARRDPNPARIAACASETKDGAKKRCVEGP